MNYSNFDKSPYSRDIHGNVKRTERSRAYYLNLLDRHEHSSYQLMYCQAMNIGNPLLYLPQADESDIRQNNEGPNDAIEEQNAVQINVEQQDAEQINVEQQDADVDNLQNQQNRGEVNLNESFDEEIQNDPPIEPENARVRQSTLLQRKEHVFIPPEFPTPDYKRYQNFHSKDGTDSLSVINPEIGQL